ncbi:TetR/AcrR family transcriptional regulator [Nocardioides ferulae]|uniref:TetR/AcrR family transcriptional regulator n=1 Tax=Nocardioides ferulae TaxID=2340821 RepID=UPI000EB11D0B|nr:TetR/AcrR family transcriptional regulator [Nocardioides ferulae]
MVASDGPSGGGADDGGFDDGGFDGAVLHRVPRQARSREKVVRALAAAERLLERDGAPALTVTGVAREAGLSVGALHQYLPDREAMTRALLTRYHARFERLLARLVEEAAGRPGGIGELDVVVAAFADLHRRSAGVRALRGERPDSEPETREHKARMAALLLRLLRELGLLAGVSDDRAALVARTAFATADALMHEAFREDPEGDPRLLAELDRLLAAYLHAAAADGTPTRDAGSSGPAG